MADERTVNKHPHRFNSATFAVHNGDTTIDVKLKLSGLAKRMNQAQYLLDSTIMDDMVPFMPMRDGLLIATTCARSQAIAGSGQVVAAAPPFGRFLYEGLVMVDPLTNSPWARKGAKKVVTDRPLNYSKKAHPRVKDHWFEEAKKNNFRKWVDMTKKNVFGGGG